MNRAAMGALALTMSAGLWGSPAAKADATSTARSGVTAAYSKEAAAFRRKDFNTALATYAPDFTGTDKKGKTVTKAQMQQQVAQLQMAKSIAPAFSIMQFALKGSQAMCTVKEHVLVVVPGQNNQTVQLIIDEVSQDTWVKSGAGWLKKRSKTLTQTQKAMVNGKLVALPN